MKQDSTNGLRTVDRVLDVLEHLAAARRAVPLGEIATDLAVPKPSLHRLLSSLQQRGYLAQDDDSGRYALGIRCFELGSQWAQSLDLRATAAPHLRSLNEATQESVHLAVYDRGDVVYVEKLECLLPVAPQSHVGRRVPAFCVATGRALLAAQPVEEQKAVLSGPLSCYTGKTIVDPDELWKMLSEVRLRGYAVNHESYRVGVGGVASSISDYTGRVIACVGVCAPETRLGPERLAAVAEKTVAAARAISADLGRPASRLPGGPTLDQPRAKQFGSDIGT